MTYDFSGLANGTGFVPVVRTANEFTGGILGIFILVIIGLTIFFGLRAGMANPVRESLAASAFIVCILSVLFALIGLVDPYTVGATVIILIGAGIMLINNRG